MTSVGLLSSGYEASTSGTTDRLPDEMNGMSIRDEKVKIGVERLLDIYCYHLLSLFANLSGSGSRCCQWQWDGGWSYYCDDCWWKKFTAEAGSRKSTAMGNS